jgi:hypothetical protein
VGDRYVIPAADDKGRSSTLWFRTQPAYARRIQDVVAGRRFPWRSVSDFVRWAVAHGLDHADTVGGADTTTGQIQAANEVLAEDEMLLEYRALIDRLGRVLQTHIDAGETGRARMVLSRTRHQLAQIPDEYWRARYLEDVDTRYGHLFATDGGIHADQTT